MPPFSGSPRFSKLRRGLEDEPRLGPSIVETGIWG